MEIRHTPTDTINKFQEFFKTESSRSVGQNVYTDIFDSPCFPLQRMNELGKMMQIAKKINPTTVYEVGAARGGGLYHWCKCLPTVKRVIACDPGGLPYADVFEEAFPSLNFLWERKGSWDPNTIYRVAKWLDKSGIDILFLDGDKINHTKDFDGYLPYMSKSGIVFMHDINENGGSVKCFDEIKRREYRTETIVDRTESKEAAERAIQQIPPKNGYEGWLRHWKGRSAGVGVIYLAKKRKK